jgi:hypothetical protein
MQEGSVVHGHIDKWPNKQVKQGGHTPNSRAAMQAPSAVYEDDGRHPSGRVWRGGEKTKKCAVDNNMEVDALPMHRQGGPVNDETNSGLEPHMSPVPNEEGTSPVSALPSGASLCIKPPSSIQVHNTYFRTETSLSIAPHRSHLLVENSWTQADVFSEQTLRVKSWSGDSTTPRRQSAPSGTTRSLPLPPRRASSIHTMTIAPPDGVRLPPITGGHVMGAFPSALNVNLPPLRDIIQKIGPGSGPSSCRGTP